MKAYLILCLLGTLASTPAFAGKEGGGGTPFTNSGENIQTIFKSEKLWRKLGSPVETILFKGYAEDLGGMVTSTYVVTTTENISILDKDGVTVGWRKVPCLVVVDVADTDPDIFTVNLEVTNANFSACPETAGK